VQRSRPTRPGEPSFRQSLLPTGLPEVRSGGGALRRRQPITGRRLSSSARAERSRGGRYTYRWTESSDLSAAAAADMSLDLQRDPSIRALGHRFYWLLHRRRCLIGGSGNNGTGVFCGAWACGTGAQSGWSRLAGGWTEVRNSPMKYATRHERLSVARFDAEILSSYGSRSRLHNDRCGRTETTRMMGH